MKKIILGALLTVFFYQARLNAQFGDALLFNGSSGYVRANSVSIALGGTPNMTIETWCYPTASSGWRSIAAFNFTGDPNNNKNMIEYDAGTLRFAYYDEVIKEKYSSSTYAPHAWYHVAVVITGGNCFLYVNGTNQNTFSTAVRPDGSANGLFSIGQEWDDAVPTEFFAGYIDEVRIWNIARSQADIQNNLYSTLAGNEPGLIAYYTMSNGTGIVLTDITGHGHTGSLIGGVSFSTPSSPLPVELTFFTAITSGNNVLLNWKTATEVNNYGFDVERACSDLSESLVNGEQSLVWENIGFVSGHGNSNSPKEYSFVDENPPAGNLQYRLKQIDTDGKYEYFITIAEVSYSVTDVGESIPTGEENNRPTEFSLSQNYPNPFNPTTKIKYSIPQAGYTTLKVYSILGTLVGEIVNEYKQPGNYEVKFSTKGGSASALSSGVYLYQLKSGSFSEVKKLVLTK